MKVIMLDSGITELSNVNMNGCRGWRCTVRSRKSDVIAASHEAILINSMIENYQRNTNKYYIFFTQVIMNIYWK